MSLCMGCMTEKGENEICPNCGLNENDLMAASPAFIQPGHQLKQGRYVVGIALGQGGFGVTYIGFDNVLGTKVAIKEYYPSDVAQRVPGDRTILPFTGSDDFFEHGKQKFLEEAQTLAKFSDYPGIVSVRDCFDENGTAYMVMQYLDGIDLKTYIQQQGGNLSTEESVNILMPVLSALKEVHKAGVIHRDISPDNIFMTSGGQVKLIDFGAAKQSVGGQKSLSVTLKPGYAPEEQYRTRGNQGPWTDVYALTATLYRMITGCTPPDSLERVMNDGLTIPGYMPPNIQYAIKKGMAVKAAERFSSVDELREALINPNCVGDTNTQGNMGNRGSMGSTGNVGGNPSGNQAKGFENSRPDASTGDYNNYYNNTGNSTGKKLIIAAVALATAVICAAIVLIAVAVGKGDDSSNVSSTATTSSSTATTTPKKKTKVIKESEYRVVVKMCTWQTAYVEAEQAGGHLVTINDAQEFTKVKSILSGYSSVRNVWVGAYAPDGYTSPSLASSYWNSSDAKWITGEPFTFAQWRDGEPSGCDKNTGVSEKYIQIFKPKADGVWSFNDASDDLRYYKSGTVAYIIEFETERTVEE